MKRILSLFLSLILVISMISGTIISQAAPGTTGLVKAVDTRGRNYSDYASDLASIFVYNQIIPNACASDATAINLSFQRADKQSSMRIMMYPISLVTETTGKHTISFKLYGEKENPSHDIDFNTSTIQVNKQSSENGSFSLAGLDAKTWHDIKIVFDLDAIVPKVTLTSKYVDTGLDSLAPQEVSLGASGFHDLFTYISYTAPSTHDMLIKDILYTSDYGEEKASILSVGSDGSGVVPFGQNEVQFKLDKEIPGLTKDHVVVKNSQMVENNATAISVTSDGTYPIVIATLENNLDPWSNYNVIVKNTAYAGYKEISGSDVVNVTDLTMAFTTPSAPLDIREAEFTITASSVTADTDVRNETSNPENITLILTNKDANGIMKSVVPDKKTVASLGGEEHYTLGTSFAEGDTAKLFVIKDLANPVQVFDKYWAIGYDSSTPEPETPSSAQDTAAGTIKFQKFDYDLDYDYDNNKIIMHLNTGAGETVKGVLYIFEGNAMSDGNLPVYADYITTAADGTYAKEIKFAESFTNSSGEYTVAFYSNALGSSVQSTFTCYDDADLADYISNAENEILRQKKQMIYNKSKASSTFSGLMQAITGTNANGEVVDDSWGIFSSDVGSTHLQNYYNKLSNKENVYIQMRNDMSSVNNFTELVTLFKNKSEKCYEDENTPKETNPTNDNKTSGPSSVVISDSGKGTVTGVAGKFTDMTGHWASKHATVLAEKGIVNGYQDGSFRADNAITRAELTKIIVEALKVPEGTGSAFKDVSASSWYSQYVSRAAAAGVVTGFENGTFGPDANVSRQDAALMIYRAINIISPLPEGYKFYADELDISDYASPAIRCLSDLGIITGTGDNTFKPLNNITRGEMAALVCRAMDYVVSHLE